MKDPRVEELVRLIGKHQQYLFSYIFSMVPRRSDAEDILQEALLTVYEKFDDFEIGSNFRAWATNIAYWKVRESRLKYARSKVIFDDKVIEVLNQTFENIEDDWSDRHFALENCLGQLKEKDRKMVLTRYERGNSVSDAAIAVGRSLDATYKSLSRI